MGIYIKGMEMPRHCGECGIEWCGLWKRLIIAGMSIAKERPQDCPLVEIPPHGRLIDADALITRTILNVNHVPYIARSDVEDAPTIIPADPAEEATT